MKKSKIPIILLGVVALTLFGIFMHKQSIDGLPGYLFARLVETDTEYTEGYSDSGFRKINIGQTSEEVLEILGKPFNFEREQRKRKLNGRWMYSRSPGSTHYLYREVRFKEGKVFEVDGHFYID